LQAFFDAHGDAVDIRLPFRVEIGGHKSFETLSKAVNGLTLGFRHQVRVRRERKLGEARPSTVRSVVTAVCRRS